MRAMNRAIAASLLAVTLAAGCASSSRPFNQPLVSIAELAANADHYNGKLVYVEGYGSAGAQTDAICADPVPASRDACLPLQIDFGPSEAARVQWQALDGRPIEVGGFYDKAKGVLHRVTGAWLEESK